MSTLSMFPRNNFKYKIVSLEPISGDRVDVYSQSVQDMINTALISGQKSIYLGELCFNATVYFTEENKWYQTTPRIFGTGTRHESILKEPGFREVIKIPVDQEELRVWRNQSGQWKYYIDNMSLVTEIKNVKCVDNSSTTPVWQWCQYLQNEQHDAKWYNYSNEHNIQLEEAFTQKNTEVTIIVGIISYTIKFDENHRSFAIQENSAYNKARLVRRAFLNQDEIENITTEGVCVICFDNINNSSIPISSPFLCTHSFHGTCIQFVLDNDKPCPTCRAEKKISSMFNT